MRRDKKCLLCPPTHLCCINFDFHHKRLSIWFNQLCFYSLVWYVSQRQSLTTRVNSFPMFRVLSVVALLVAEKYIPIVMHLFGDKGFTNSCIFSLSALYCYFFISFKFNTIYIIHVHAVLFIFMMPVGDMSMFLVRVCDEGRRGQSIRLQDIL